MPLRALGGNGNDRSADRRPVIVYVINSFERGGAETGLVALVNGGLFANCQLKIVALARGSGGLEAKLEDLGNPPEILLDRARMRARDMPRILIRLWRFIGRAQPNVVIGSLPQANLLARVCVLLRKQITFISFEHNSHLAKRIYETGYRLTSWRVDWLFADAASTMKTATERLYRRIPPTQTVVPLVSFGSAANRFYTPSNPFHVANAGRFTATKNQAALIEAVAILNRADRNVTLTLFGEGPARDACEALAARLGVVSRICFPGFVHDWARHPADLFVLSSKHEGLCIVVLEAMHAGIPVAAPIIGGLRDYAAPGVVQVLASVDPRTIASAIVAAMDDRANSQAMVANAAEMIDRNFGAHAVRKRYSEINRAIITRATTSGRTRPTAPARNAASRS
jgi:glycosyltransferase involved in cell wall biosynthesis